MYQISRSCLHNHSQLFSSPKSTKNSRPLKLVYYQAFLSKIDARREEKRLKAGSNARNDLKSRIANYLA